MNISAVGHGHDLASVTRFQQSAQRLSEPTEADVRSVSLTGDADPTVERPVDDTDLFNPEADSDESGRERGVLRLLEAGHFGGVAEARLRINFFDELTTRANVTAAPARQEQSQALITTITEQATALAATFSTDAEASEAIGSLLADFEAAVQDAAEDSATDSDALADTIQGAFETLVDNMRDLLSPTTETGGTSSDPVDRATSVTQLDRTDGLGLIGPLSAATTAPLEAVASREPIDLRGETPTQSPGDLTDGTGGVSDTPIDGPVDQPVADAPIIDEPTQTLDDALAALTAAFQEALSTLVASTSTSTLLPDLAPPKGNGAAFEKFSAIYDALRGVDSTIDELA